MGASHERRRRRASQGQGDRRGRADMAVKLPERFVLVIEGALARITTRAVIVPDSLPYLISRLLSGHPVAEDAFEAFGLRVTAEIDTDGGGDPDSSPPDVLGHRVPVSDPCSEPQPNPEPRPAYRDSPVRRSA